MILVASTATASGWGILLTIAGGLFWHWVSTRTHKSEIRREVSKMRAKLVRIRWLPWHDALMDHQTFYEVTLMLPSGRRVSAICYCNNWDDVQWQSTPWSQELLREPAPETQFAPASQPKPVVADCSHCGYGLYQGGVVCANCGTEVSA